jgi:hypothetical protein
MQTEIAYLLLEDPLMYPKAVCLWCCDVALRRNIKSVNLTNSIVQDPHRERLSNQVNQQMTCVLPR